MKPPQLLIQAPPEKILLLAQLRARRKELEEQATRERNARLARDREGRFATPGALATHIDPRRVTTPMLDLLDAELLDIHAGHTRRLGWSCAPQEGKSQAISRAFPLWTLLKNPNTRIGIASYEATIARRWGRQIRNDIFSHPELGLTVRPDTSAAHEWQLEGYDGGVITVGVGGALTGRPLDLLIVDDPIKGRAEADSQTYRDQARDWWQETAVTRLAPGAPAIVLMTRWHEDDLLGWLVASDPDAWRYINIPTEAEAGDVLGRAPGDWLVSARGRTPEQWEEIRRQVGARGWAALYQGRPSPAEGTLFKRGHWRYFPAALIHTAADGTCRADSMDELVQSWDMAFKDTKGSDYVVGQVWGRRGAEVFLLDQVRDRLDFPATCRAVEALTAKWPQAAGKFVEDKANGPAVISQLRARVPGLIPITPKDSKYARASAVAPFVEAGNVHLPDATTAPWVGALIEEAAGFPNASNDDQVDALSQALSRMLGDQGSANAAMDWLRGYAPA